MYTTWTERAWKSLVDQANAMSPDGHPLIAQAAVDLFDRYMAAITHLEDRARR